MATAAQSNKAFFNQLKRYYSFYTGGFIAFIIFVAILEQLGVPAKILGYMFLFATILLYAGIGFMSKTAEVSEYYVAGRRVPALFNGMATGADWMSAASFIGMAGTLYATGYDGLAFVMGWTGGYCLVALFLAPYLRKFGQFTIPDFLGARYGGNIPRLIGVIAAIICSFTYVIAQIYGVGLITSRFTGLEFGIGVFVGLAGILVCSFLGGMKAVTWTQVAQYIILIVAYMIPVVWLSVKHTGNPIPQIAAYTTALPKVTALEKEFNNKETPKGAAEESVRAIFRERAAAADAKLKALEAGGAAYLAEEKAKLEAKLAELKAADPVDAKAVEAAEKAVKEFPTDPAKAKEQWTKDKTGAAAKAAPVKAHAEPFPAAGKTEEEKEKNRAIAKKNFLALIFCLMVGTAALPHILMRYYTTPSVKEARISVFWSLFFIFLLYFTAPALAVLVTPVVILLGSAIAVLTEAGLAGMASAGPHGLSEVLYAFSSATGNNGSAFAGLSANSAFYNTALGIAMLLGRFAVIVPILAMAGSLAAKPIIPASAGTFPTYGLLFVLLLAGTILVFAGLAFFPALALGPIVEHFLADAGRFF
jgi:cation/acetate symporter